MCKFQSSSQLEVVGSNLYSAYMLSSLPYDGYVLHHVVLRWVTMTIPSLSCVKLMSSCSSVSHQVCHILLMQALRTSWCISRGGTPLILLALKGEILLKELESIRRFFCWSVAFTKAACVLPLIHTITIIHNKMKC